ncbi:MAG: glycosyltransferase family 4 protein [Patescibacteria group bacterium]|nr:glycosyltransferase family 4 protein [Patescibacteria group bacterium]
MKLVIAADIFPPDIGGPATYSLKLAEKLTALGWQVKLVCYSDQEHQDNFSFAVARINRQHHVIARYWRYFVILFSLSADADVIYAQGPVSAGLPAALVAKLLKKKLVVKIVGDYAWEYARNSKKSTLGIDEFQTARLTGKVRRLKKIETWVCRRADKIITPSFYLKKIVSGWGINDGKIEVIYNSEPTSRYTISPAAINKNQLLSVGRLVPWKGFEVLIEVVKELNDQNDHFNLIILGDGPDKKNLVKKISSFGASEFVLIKTASQLEVVDEMSQSGIFILNSGYEGLSHTILEAFSAGVPVIASNIGGNPELITDGENGILVEYNNKEQLKAAIIKIANDDELRKSFIDKSTTVLENFSESRMLGRIKELLEQL